MPMLVIDLNGAAQKTVGLLSRRLLEVRPGTFVGNLPRRAIEQTWETVVQSQPKAALLITTANNEMGLRIKQVGHHRHQPQDFDGVTLVTFLKSRKAL